jgi:hypothetical protein
LVSASPLMSRIPARHTPAAKTLTSATRQTLPIASAVSRGASRMARAASVAIATAQVNASRRMPWKHVTYAESNANDEAPSRPATGLVGMRQATEMQTVPTTTHAADSAREGQRWRNQRSAITAQHAVTTTARTWPIRPFGPSGLTSEIIGTRPRVAMTPATTRHVLACRPRPARMAVNQ